MMAVRGLRGLPQEFDLVLVGLFRSIDPPFYVVGIHSRCLRASGFFQARPGGDYRGCAYVEASSTDVLPTRKSKA